MLLSPSGFREYDARWQFPDQIDLEGLRAVGRGIGTQLMRRGQGPKIIVGHDFRSYSTDVKNAVIEGLIETGAHVYDIGLSLSPMAYFARYHLDVQAVAMVTASHNPNGWTGVKIGIERPFTHGASDMAELAKITLSGDFVMQTLGRVEDVKGIKQAFLEDISSGQEISNPLRVVCATGNGTAGAFAPEMLRRIGATVITRHCDLDDRFPHYNPNPEALEMLDDLGKVVRQNDADFGVALDGDGDRIGVVDEAGRAISADKLGLLMARELARIHPNSRFLADIKSTGLFLTDPELKSHTATFEYCATGHSHIKQKMGQTNALAAFEKSGHFYFGPPVGRGYDCALRAIVVLCQLVDRHKNRSLSSLLGQLPRSWVSPSCSPACADEQKYQVVQRLTAKFKSCKDNRALFAGRQIMDILTINGVRAILDDGSWVLIRASSNTPNLVLVCESFMSEADLHLLFKAADELLQSEPHVGAYDQTL